MNVYMCACVCNTVVEFLKADQKIYTRLTPDKERKRESQNEPRRESECVCALSHTNSVTKREKHSPCWPC